MSESSRATLDRGGRCPKHGTKYLFERRGIGCTEFRCDRCAWKSGEMLTELFKSDDADREMLGDDADYFEPGRIGNK